MISPLYFVAILVLVSLSAFFSASEMSFSSTNKLRLENMVDDEIAGAKLALKVAEKFDDALSAILIGNNLVNIAMSSIGSVIAILIAGEEWTWVATAIITVLVIIFGETMPKIVAKKNANKLVLVFCYPIYALTVILKPLIWLVVGLANLIMMLLPKERTVRDEDEAQQELQSIIETAEDENVLDEERSELVQNALEFGDIRVSEVMTARVDIEAIDIEDSFEEIMELAEGSSYSRLPVYEDGIDNVIGILYLNKFYRALTERENVEVREVLSKPVYVYKTTKLPAALTALRSAKQHLLRVQKRLLPGKTTSWKKTRSWSIPTGSMSWTAICSSATSASLWTGTKRPWMQKVLPSAAGPSRCTVISPRKGRDSPTMVSCWRFWKWTVFVSAVCWSRKWKNKTNRRLQYAIACFEMYDVDFTSEQKNCNP